MPRIVNRTGLPAPLVMALRDDYSRGEANISATGLLSPPRKAALEELHAAELEEDAADKAAILIGKAVHAAIAAHATNDLSDQRRLMMAVNGWVVSGQTDNVDDDVFTVHGGRIIDYKTVAVNVYQPGKIRDDRMEEYEGQLNTYAELLRTHGMVITGLAIVMIFKDWSAPQAHFGNNGYPEKSISEVEVGLWSRERTQAFLIERVALHQAARVELPECTPKERWMRDEVWSVRKRGNERATKNHESEAAAMAHAAELNKTSNVPYTVEFKPGTPVRCRWYCTPGNLGLCSQHNKWLEENTSAD